MHKSTLTKLALGLMLLAMLTFATPAQTNSGGQNAPLIPNPPTALSPDDRDVCTKAFYEVLAQRTAKDALLRENAVLRENVRLAGDLADARGVIADRAILEADQLRAAAGKTDLVIVDLQAELRNTRVKKKNGVLSTVKSGVEVARAGAAVYGVIKLAQLIF